MRTPLFKVPLPSTDFIADAMLCGSVIKYEYMRDKTNIKSGIKFNNVRAKRTRAPVVCTTWHIKDAYDTLVEVEQSDWVKEVLFETQDRRERSGEAWELRHYLIYLDGTGCIEVLADSWCEIPEDQGSWT